MQGFSDILYNFQSRLYSGQILACTCVDLQHIVLVHKEGNGWKERKEETDTGVHTGRPPHIIEGTEGPSPAFRGPDMGENGGGEEAVRETEGKGTDGESS